VKKEALARRCKDLGYLDLSNELNSFFDGLNDYDGSFYYDKKLAGKILDVEKLATKTKDSNIVNGVKTLTAQWWNHNNWLDTINPNRKQKQQQQQANDAMSNWQTVRQDDQVQNRQREFEQQSEQYLNKAKQQMAMEVQDELSNVVQMGQYLNSAWQTINMHHQNYVDSINKLESAYESAKQGALESAQDDTVRQWLQQKTFQDLDNDIMGFKQLLQDEDGVDVGLASQLASGLYQKLTGNEMQMPESNPPMEQFQPSQKDTEGKWESLNTPPAQPVDNPPAQPTQEQPAQRQEEKGQWESLQPPKEFDPSKSPLTQPKQKDQWESLQPPKTFNDKESPLSRPGVTEQPKQEPEGQWESLEAPKPFDNEKSPLAKPLTVDDYRSLSRSEKQILTQELNKYLNSNFGVTTRDFSQRPAETLKYNYFKDKNIPADLVERLMESGMKKPKTQPVVNEAPVVEQPAPLTAPVEENKVVDKVDTSPEAMDALLNKPQVDVNKSVKDLNNRQKDIVSTFFDKIYDSMKANNPNKDIALKDFSKLIEKVVSNGQFGEESRGNVTSLINKKLKSKLSSPVVENNEVDDMKKQISDFSKQKKPMSVVDPVRERQKPDAVVNDKHDLVDNSKIVNSFGEDVGSFVSDYLNKKNVKLDEKQQSELFQRLDNLGIPHATSDEFNGQDALMRVKDRLPSIVDRMTSPKTIEQPTSKPINELADKPTSRPINELADKPTSRPINELADKPTSRPPQNRNVPKRKNPLDLNNEVSKMKQENKDFYSWLEKNHPQTYDIFKEKSKDKDKPKWLMEMFDSYKKEYKYETEMKSDPSTAASSWKTIRLSQVVNPFKRTSPKDTDTIRLNNNQVDKLLAPEEGIPSYDSPKIMETIPSSKTQDFDLSEIMNEPEVEKFDYNNIYKKLDTLSEMTNRWIVNPEYLRDILNTVGSEMQAHRDIIVSDGKYNPSHLKILNSFWNATDSKIEFLKGHLGKPNLDETEINKVINEIRTSISKGKTLENPNMSIDEVAKRAAMGVAVPATYKRQPMPGEPTKAPARRL